LLAEAALRPLVALAVDGVAAGRGRGLAQRPAQVAWACSLNGTRRSEASDWLDAWAEAAVAGQLGREGKHSSSPILAAIA
jgi:hypothetical protein